MTDVAQAETGPTSAGEGSSALPFPFTRKCPLSTPHEYAELRTHSPATKVRLQLSGKEAWLLTRHEDVKKVLGDPAMSSDAKRPGYPLQFPVPEEVLQFIKFPFSALDAPEHTVQRRLVIPEFTARRIQDLRPRIQEIVDERIDALLAGEGPADLVKELAAPVPSLLFCEMLGADPADIDYFRRYSEVTMNRESTQEDVIALYAEMDGFLGRLITEKEKNPGDDLLSRLAAKNREEDAGLELADLVSIARLLVVAGFDTTANMIGLGTLVLLQNPEAADELRADPSLTRKAVDELLRFLSIADSATVRVATDDVEVGGITIRAGEGVIASNGAANWDGAVFENPHVFDIHRDAKNHLAFSYGAHQCLGANLARVQLEIVFDALLARIPTLRLAAPLEELSFMHGGHIYGLHQLPVTW
ncbi:cytochrome P450 [Streptomyces sp. NBC_00328]|uniref:cytochrome P450 n=1 Tax=Streptomyces sp. NBC_00328 TaxID=2903646 RepID=UPI002E2C9163|nr:cytochrome P450 [Streptomyces sp. NBC_00328]